MPGNKEEMEINNNTKRVKSLKMKRDVGWHDKKITQTREDIKVKVTIHTFGENV